ncbi:MAG: hypothetical protein K2L02_01065 [Clostridia bacterium]|nr:hypothetical protein [Clostridia bacterium]
MKEYQTNAQRAKRSALIRKIIAALLTASIVLFLAVFFSFVPFRLMLPAYKVAAREEGELRLHFLDLKGGVTVVEFPDGEVLVVNAGDGSFEGDNTLCRFLRGLDMTSLSVLATSDSTSHIGGMCALFETVQVKKTYFPAFSADTGAFTRFLSAVDKEGCEKEKLVRYSAIENSSGAYAVCLSPYSQEEGATEEEASTVLYLSYAGVNIVLTGDLTAKREGQLVNEYTLFESVFDKGNFRVRLDQTDILLAPSHGSDRGSSEAWLSLLNPKTTVICCNQSERPSDNALSRIAAHSGEVLRTDELGIVTVSVKDGAYRVQTHIL